MKKLLKEAKVSWDESIIGITTDKKSTENVFFDTLLNGVPFLIVGIVLFICLFTYPMALVMAAMMQLMPPFIFQPEPDRFVIEFINFVYICCGIASMIFIFIARKQLRRKGNWYAIFYPEHILYKTRNNKHVDEQSIPYALLTNGYIYSSKKHSYRLFHQGKLVKKVYDINLLLEYEEYDVTHYIHMTGTNRYNDVNKIISFLQHTYDLPIYVTPYKVGKNETMNPQEHDDFEKIHFSGDVHSII